MAFLDKNDNCITLSGLKNDLTGDYVNDATVTATISDQLGGVLVSALALSYIAASNGIYSGTVLSTDDLGEHGDKVVVEITATSGDGSVFYAKDSKQFIYDRKLDGGA